jgi:threonine dehydratase
VRGGLAASSAYGEHGQTVVTASAGNHGLGIAYAASALGIPATVFVPETASTAKIAALRRYPIELRLEGDSYDDAEAAALDHAAQTNGLFVSAYTDPHVIADQATVVHEVAADLAVRSGSSYRSAVAGSPLVQRSARRPTSLSSGSRQRSHGRSLRRCGRDESLTSR